MSRAGTPTLPWAIPCYHLMQNALTANCTDGKLRPALRQAAQAGLNRLNYYYKIALSNHYNVIATGKSSRNQLGQPAPLLTLALQFYTPISGSDSSRTLARMSIQEQRLFLRQFMSSTRAQPPHVQLYQRAPHWRKLRVHHHFCHSSRCLSSMRTIMLESSREASWIGTC